jgi:hypothetical protein
MRTETIIGFPSYTISEDGTVTNVNTGKAKKPSTNSSGYLQVALFEGGKRKFKLVHRLIAQHFMAGSDDLPVINHINGNKTDNRIENLEWCTQSHNMEHAHSTGLIASRLDGKLNLDEVNRIRELIEEGVQGTVIAKMFAISKSMVSNIKLGKRWQAA